MQAEDQQQRFAIYTRISSDMQAELSLEAQEACCRDAITERGGGVVAVYSDSAKSGWSLERDGFNALRTAAERGQFDAVMFWKFDRLARDHEHALMIKMLLRHEYGLKLYCVEGFSEDDDESPTTSLMEQMLAVFSAFYSKNLSNETKRGKRQRALRGEYNGSKAPLGYTLVTVKEATPDKPAGLHINPQAASIVRQAFERYAAGGYSDGDVAAWMNGWSYIQQLRQGQKPVNKEMIRELLQNRTYTGRVPHTDTIYSGSLGQSKASRRGRTEWFEGKHDAIISDELFEKAQQARANSVSHRDAPHQIKTYLLNDRLFCARCIARKPHGLVHARYGRMRSHWSNGKERASYHCLAHNHGYEKCGQKGVPVSLIDDQLVHALKNLYIPEYHKGQVEHEINSLIENEVAAQRMQEIQAMVKRLNFSWEEGFLSPEDYLAKREQLQRNIEARKSVDSQEQIQAADLLDNFAHYWQQCSTDESRKQLVAKIVKRVYVYDKQLLAIVLHGDFTILMENKTAPLDVMGAVVADCRF